MDLNDKLMTIDSEHTKHSGDGENHPSAAGDGTKPLTLKTVAIAALGAGAGLFDANRTNSVPELVYIEEQVNAIGNGNNAVSGALASALNHPAPEDIHLVQLSEKLTLTRFEILATALALAVENDVMTGRVVAYLQKPLGGSRPTLGLLVTGYQGFAPKNRSLVASFVSGNAVKSGLMVLSGNHAPLTEQFVRIPTHTCLSLMGLDGFFNGASTELERDGTIPLTPSVLRTAEKHGEALMKSSMKTLVIRSGSMSEGKSAADAVARKMGLRPLFLDAENTRALAPLLLLRLFLPVFSVDVAPGDRKVLPAIACYNGPVIAVCGPDGSVESDAGSGLNWIISKPGRRERKKLWQIAVGSKRLADKLSRHHRHSMGRIDHLGRLSHHQSLLEGRTRPREEDVLAASWIGERGGLDSLAQAMPEKIEDDAFVMTKGLKSDLDALSSRCRARDNLVKNLGASSIARYKPGVKTLFVGPSGTGKTLAAGWLATKMGLPLFRVDLASVTSKYIGETEKNLSQLLARAEQSEVILLFDEADSLFGKRTDVQQANDRFANAQTNYLLQRIETYDGIVILTSNSRSRFDTAFSRRLDMIIEFPIPGPKERRKLWHSHLGRHHSLSKKEINQLSAAADLTGGHIRNAVLAAAVTARQEKSPIQYEDVKNGLEREYRKMSRQMPVELNNHPKPSGKNDADRNHTKKR